MQLKTILTIAMITSMSSNAQWVKSNKTLYGVMELAGANIVSINSVGKDNNHVLSTIYTDSGLYRCSDNWWMQRSKPENWCYVLTND